MQVLCHSDQGMMSLINSSALQLSVEAVHRFGGDVEVVRCACGVVDVLAEAGECVRTVRVCVCVCPTQS